MNKKFLLIGAGVIVFLFLVIAYGFRDKCPEPEENIPGAPGFREDCDIAGTDVTDTNNVLDLWVLYDNTESFQGQIQAFQSANPGLRVNVKKFTNLEEYEDLIVNEIAEKEGPDVFMIPNAWVRQNTKKLYPLPVSETITMTPDLFRETFFQAAIDDLIIENQIYGMPMSIDNLAIFYNEQQFADFIATSDEPAAVWEALQEQVAALTEPDNSPERFARVGIAMGRADNISSAVDILYALMLQHGVEFYDEEEENATFAESRVAGAVGTGVQNPGVAAMDLFTSFGLPSYKNYSWNQNITGAQPADKELNPFIRGKVTMIIGYPYMYQNIVAAIQAQQELGNTTINIDDVGIAPFPQLVAGPEATQRDTYASYFPLVVASTTDKPALAWSLVQHLTTAESLQTYHQVTNRPTSRKNMVTEQQVEPVFGTFAMQAPFAKSFRIYDEAAYRKVFSDAIQKVVSNTVTSTQAMTEAQQKITCIVQKQKGIRRPETDCQI